MCACYACTVHPSSRRLSHFHTSDPLLKVHLQRCPCQQNTWCAALHCADTFARSQRYTSAPAGPAVTLLADDGAHCIPWSEPGLLFSAGKVWLEGRVFQQPILTSWFEQGIWVVLWWSGRTPPCLWFVCYQCVRQSLLDNFSHLPKLSPFLLNRDLVTFYITQIYNKVIFFLQEQQEQLQHTTLTTVLGRQSSFKYLSLSLPSISIQALLCLS